MRLVDFFVIGAPKCGSTLLYEYFSLNPSISVGTKKEINYFSSEWLLDVDSYYEDTKTLSIDDYHANYDASLPIWIDFSVSYFLCDDIEEKIFQYNPNAKIIILSRDPVRRALSHYEMDRRLGCHSMPLGAVLEDQSSFAYQQVVGNSQYEVVIERFVARFGDNNVFVSPDIHTPSAQRKVCEFLMLEYIESDLGVVNKAIYPAFGFIYSVIRLVSRNNILRFILKRRPVIWLVKKFMFSDSRPTYSAKDLETLWRCINDGSV